VIGLACQDRPVLPPTFILDPVRAVATLAGDRVFHVFGDHSYRMDLRG
jgi:hypothetical protein